jgi:polysaccharide export outer membrane protein
VNKTPSFNISLILGSLLLLLNLLLLDNVVWAGEAYYSLGAGDKINIHVYGQEDLSLSASIDDDGTIVYPFIGEIHIRGMTLSQLEKKITGFLKGDYLINPNVHVSIEEYRPFYIHGQVKQPGGYPYQPGLTVRRAVSLGGGFTERAAKSKIFVTHPGSGGKRVRVKKHERLKPGDVVTVEESFF